jgi:hypothetical protein
MVIKFKIREFFSIHEKFQVTWSTVKYSTHNIKIVGSNLATYTGIGEMLLYLKYCDDIKAIRYLVQLLKRIIF